MKNISPTRIGNVEPIESCVIFIHGLAGSIRTWDIFSRQLKEQWSSDESFGIEYDQYTVEFRIPWIDTIIKAIAGGPPIDILADSLNTTINEVCKDYQNVVIIAHSMGGLIARKYLVNTLKNKLTVGKIRGLITYATPHKGSILATYYKRYTDILNVSPFYLLSPQIVQMCKMRSDFLNQLNKDWEDLRVESRIDFRRVVGERDFVVDRDSASFAWKDPSFDSIANKNHFNIIKPRKPKDPAFLVAFNYLKDFKSNLEKRREQEELDALAEEDDF